MAFWYVWFSPLVVKCNRVWEIPSLIKACLTDVTLTLEPELQVLTVRSSSALTLWLQLPVIDRHELARIVVIA